MKPKISKPTAKETAQLVIALMGVFPVVLFSFFLGHTLTGTRLMAEISFRSGEVKALQFAIDTAKITNQQKGRAFELLSQQLVLAKTEERQSALQLADHSKPFLLYGAITFQCLLGLIGGCWLLGVVGGKGKENQSGLPH